MESETPVGGGVGGGHHRSVHGGSLVQGNYSTHRAGCAWARPTNCPQLALNGRGRSRRVGWQNLDRRNAAPRRCGGGAARNDSRCNCAGHPSESHTGRTDEGSASLHRRPCSPRMAANTNLAPHHGRGRTFTIWPSDPLKDTTFPDCCAARVASVCAEQWEESRLPGARFGSATSDA